MSDRPEVPSSGAGLEWVSGLPALVGEPLPAASDRIAAITRALGTTDAPDVRLWRARGGADVDVDAILHAAEAGPIVPQEGPIEVWTDRELAALHAAWWLAQSPDREPTRERLRGAVTWHLEFTQPDNATNRPWAVHVFALDGRAEAQLYAQTLVHNALSATGELNELARLLVADALAAMGRPTDLDS